MVNTVIISGLTNEWSALNHLQTWVPKNAKSYFGSEKYLKAEGCVRDGLVTLGSVKLGTIEGTVSDGGGLSSAVTLVLHQNLLTATCNCAAGRAGRCSARQAALNGNTADAPPSCHHLAAFLLWAVDADNKASLSPFVCGGTAAFSYKGYLATYKSREQLIEMLDQRSSTCEKREGLEEYTATSIEAVAVTEEDPPLVIANVRGTVSTTSPVVAVAPKAKPVVTTPAHKSAFAEKSDAAPKKAATPKKVVAAAPKTPVGPKAVPLPKAAVSAPAVDNSSKKVAPKKKKIVIEEEAPAELVKLFVDARELINETWCGDSGGPGEIGTDLGPELQGIFVRSIEDYFITHPHHVQLQLCGLIEYLHCADLCSSAGCGGSSDEDGDEEDELNSFCSNDVCEIFIDFILSQPEDQQHHILKEFIDVERRHIGDCFFQFNFVDVILKFYMDGSVKSPQLLAFLNEEEKRDRSGLGGTLRPPDEFGSGYEGSSVQAEVRRARDGFGQWKRKRAAEERERDNERRNLHMNNRSTYYSSGHNSNNYYNDTNRGYHYHDRTSYFPPVPHISAHILSGALFGTPASTSPIPPTTANAVSVPLTPSVGVAYSFTAPPPTVAMNNPINNPYRHQIQQHTSSNPPTPVATKPTTTLIRPRLSQ